MFVVAGVWEKTGVVLLQGAHMQDAAMPRDGMGQPKRGGWAVMLSKAGKLEGCLRGVGRAYLSVLWGCLTRRDTRLM